MCMCFVFFPNAYPWLWTSLVCDGEPFIRIPGNRLVLDPNVEKFSPEAGGTQVRERLEKRAESLN